MGQTDEVNGRNRHVARDSRGWEVPGQQIDYGEGGNHRHEWRRSAGGGDVQVGGYSDPGRIGGEKRVQHIDTGICAQVKGGKGGADG